MVSCEANVVCYDIKDLLAPARARIISGAHRARPVASLLLILRASMHCRVAMPHLTIAYSAKVAEHTDIRALLARLHDATLATVVFETGAVRTREDVRQYYVVADRHPDHGFVHALLRISSRLSDYVGRRLTSEVFESDSSALKKVQRTPSRSPSRLGGPNPTPVVDVTIGTNLDGETRPKQEQGHRLTHAAVAQWRRPSRMIERTLEKLEAALVARRPASMRATACHPS